MIGRNEECISTQRLFDVVLLPDIPTRANGHDPWRVAMYVERVVAVIETGDLQIYDVYPVFGDVELVAARRCTLRRIGHGLLDIEQ